MNVVPLLVVLSLSLAAAGVLLYLWSVRLGDVEHADRLALLPLDEDLVAPAGEERDRSERTQPSELSPADGPRSKETR